MSIKNNTTSLQNLLDAINSLPEASGGIELPTLTNEGSASDLLSGKQLIDGDGNVVTGTIATKTSSNLTASGATVTVPAGYYASQATKSVATATQATPSISVNSSGLITASATQTAGYVAAGTKSSTYQLAFQAAKTITPTTADQIAVSSGYYTGGNITVKGDSNLVAGNIKSGVSIFGVNGTLTEGSGDNIVFQMAQRTLTNATHSTVSYIGSHAFINCSMLSIASFPACTNINSNAFNNCASLETVSFPSATIIGSYAFVKCIKLKNVSFPSVVSIGGNAFTYCSKLETISFPIVTFIGDGAFQYCSKLTTANFPSATTISPYAFSNCSKLTTANFPSAISINSNAFSSCSKLETISFPVVTFIGSGAFRYCSSLKTVSFPSATIIGSSAFGACYYLKSLYLTGSIVCALSNSNAFGLTPIDGFSAYAGTYGSIYVPASLLTSYQTATNLTYFSSRFVGIGENTGGSSATTITFTIDGVQYQAEEGMTLAQWCNSEYNTIGGLVSGEQIIVFINDIGYYVCDDYGMDWYVPPSEIIYDGYEYTTEEAGFEY